jgi:hypothetical protein
MLLPAEELLSLSPPTTEDIAMMLTSGPLIVGSDGLSLWPQADRQQEPRTLKAARFSLDDDYYEEFADFRSNTAHQDSWFEHLQSRLAFLAKPEFF